MIAEFNKAWFERRGELERMFAAGHPESYLSIVKLLVERVLNDAIGYASPDAERIHEIDDGSYSGTLVFVIGAAGYAPSNYWYTMVDYGSCSGCDTLEGIRCYGSDTPEPNQVMQYMALALHLVQNMRPMTSRPLELTEYD